MHYQNGREAKIGDQVIGSVFNNGGVLIAGTLVSLTPDPDSCSAMVGYLVTIKSEDGSLPSGLPKFHGRELHGAIPVRIQGTEQHGTQGTLATTFYVQDYTECKNLLHAEDAQHATQQDALNSHRIAELQESNQQLQVKLNQTTEKAAAELQELHEQLQQIAIEVEETPTIAVAANAVAQNRAAHEEMRGQSGRTDDYEDGYLAGHTDIHDLLMTLIKLHVDEQPPIDNAHVEEGCEQFKAEPTAE